MTFVRRRPVLFLLVVPCRVLAFPLSYHTPGSTVTYIPLIVVFVSLFFLLVFLAVKLVYMKHRRIRTIHAPPGPVRSIPTATSETSFGFRDKPGNRHRGLLVGCLGSPTWETSLMSKLGDATWRREQGRRNSSFGYRLHTAPTIRSAHSASTRSRSKSYSSCLRLTKSTVLTGSCSRDADPHVLPSSSGPSCIPLPHGGSSSEKALCSVQRNSSTGCHPRYGDFGGSHSVRSPRGGVNIARRASPSSIRLVDGPSHSSQVEYSFLSGLPPNTVVPSPLMGTRDSFQLSRCSLKCDRKPVPPMPPLPSFLPFCLPNGPEIMESQSLQASEYLPPLRFSPLASVAKVFHSQQQVVGKKAFISRVSDPEESKNDVYSEIPGSESTSSTSKTQDASNTGSSTGSFVVHGTNAKSNHTRSQSCQGLAIGGTSSRTVVAAVLLSLPVEDKDCSENESIQTGVLRTSSGSSRNGSVVSRKPLKSCLRRNSVVPMPLVCSPDFTLTPSLSEASTQTYTLGTRWSTGDSLWTPTSDVDIGILGLDRFRWNDEPKELKVRSSHTKKDSVALVPYWE